MTTFPLKQDHGLEFVYEERKLQESNNYMDKWILSFTQSLLLFVKKEMDGNKIFSLITSKNYINFNSPVLPPIGHLQF